MKSQLLSLWDGLVPTTSSPTAQVIVMGATNRPEDIDEAFMRRMPLHLHVPLPGTLAREAILKTILCDDLALDSIDFVTLARKTSGFSGSDLKELCRRSLLDHSMHPEKESLGKSLLANVPRVRMYQINSEP